MCYRIEVTLWSRHMGEQEKTHKLTCMAQAQGGPLEAQNKTHPGSGVMSHPKSASLHHLGGTISCSLTHPHTKHSAAGEICCPPGANQLWGPRTTLQA